MMKKIGKQKKYCILSNTILNNIFFVKKMKTAIITLLFFVIPVFSILYVYDVENSNVGKCHQVNIDPTTKKGDPIMMTQIIAGLFLCFAGLMLCASVLKQYLRLLLSLII